MRFWSPESNAARSPGDNPAFLAAASGLPRNAVCASGSMVRRTRNPIRAEPAASVMWVSRHYAPAGSEFADYIDAERARPAERSDVVARDDPGPGRVAVLDIILFVRDVLGPRYHRPRAGQDRQAQVDDADRM